MVDGIHMAISCEESAADEELRACYDAWIQRRRARGDLSIRTPEGFRRLQKKYQPRLRFSIGAATKSAEDGDHGVEIDSLKLREIVGVYLDAKVSRMIADICWPLAHFGNNAVDNVKVSADLKLDEGKYCAFSVRLLLWIFPGLPCTEAEVIARYDWAFDRKLDKSDHVSLSFKSFTVSLIDAAVACNNGPVSKCLEFLQLMTRWLRRPMPVERSLLMDPIVSKQQAEPPAAIVWQDIPLSTLVPCQMDPRGLYCKLKTKASKAPMAIMIMATDENLVELQIATSARLLDRQNENSTDFGASIRWTFTGLNPSTPTLVIAPSSIISRQKKALYVRVCALDKSEDKPEETCSGVEQMSTGNVRGNTGQQSSDPPFVAVFTSLLEFTAHQLGSKNGICLRMNRMSLRTFAAEKYATPFSITITASLLQATSSAGGAGAAAAVSNAVEAESTFIVREEQSSEPREVADGHTFVFIVKSGEKLQEHGVTLPPQWFTSLNAASEKKTIVIESSSTDPVLTASDDKVESRPENFHIFIFTIHGLTIELSCSATTPVQEDYAQEENDTAPQLFIDTRKSESFKAGPATVYVEDGETIEFAKSFSGKPATSADLLRELLLHQKKRQLETSVEPPPDFLAGTSVSVSKPTTTAETLRAKILQSRQLERRARLQQLESDLQCKLNRTRQKSTSDAQRPESADTNAVTPHSPKSELESKVSVLATFFHEMAMHQPRRDELHTCVEEAEAEDVAEQQLLKHFGDMFDLDEDLQNTLDEEKWSTNTAKVTRRKASISTNLPKPMPDNTRRSGKQADSDEPQWTSEDYESTAQYIEQLMLDVANDEVQQQQQQTLADIERKNAVMEQLIDSWGYMQHRTATPASNQRLHELEQKRRNQWMQSERVKEYDTAASARRGDKSERAAIIFSKQRFLVQEQSIPSSAVWVVPTPPSNQTSSLASGALAAAGLITPSRPESPHLDGQAESSVKIRPRRPTQQAVIVTPPPPEERESDVTALRSAAILRARVRRIRSAHSHQKVSVTASQHSRRVTSAAISPKNAMKSENSRSVKKSVVLEIPASLLNHATQSLVYEISVDNQTSDTFLLDDDVPEDNDEVASLNISPLESAVLGTCKILGNPAAAGDEDDESNNIKGAARKKRKKKKRCAPLNVVRFRRSLMELASLPSKLQAAADDERMQNERLEELNSASFVFPSRSIKPKPNLRPQVDP